jgi:hypothetical protein
MSGFTSGVFSEDNCCVWFLYWRDKAAPRIDSMVLYPEHGGISGRINMARAKRQDRLMVLYLPNT